ncbi:hypothetical protein C8R41DRAFT_918179 [Lentinula lateritia]|uniref:Uncharacterized protein n=1 Tax=Lentinula lateritia TaxID=40482 RepID=A0ABQ8VKI8_9AGAR|nr:hypothetical protein C8R41DRAFT_918179 [Lentinula lateritia]
MRWTHEVESTTSTTSTTTSTPLSGSFGGLTRWSPPLLPPRPPLSPLDRASTTSTTTSMASGSFGGLTKWSPPLLPPRPPLPPLDHLVDSRGRVHRLHYLHHFHHHLYGLWIASPRFTHAPKKSKALPRPLVLSLQSLPASFSSPRSSPGPTSPLSPTSISTNIASSSSYHDDHDSLDDSLQTRRKRMAKLTRTLGENIPPELVFNSQLLPSHSRSTSVEAASALANLTVTAKGSTEPSRHTQETLVPLRMKRLPQTPTTMSRSASLRAPSPSFVARQMMRKRHGQPHTTSHVELTPSAGRKSSDTIRSAVSSQGGAGNGIATADTASGSLGGLEVEPTASPTSRPYGGLARWSPPPSSTASRSRSGLTREGLRWTCQREELSETE